MRSGLIVDVSASIVVDVDSSTGTSIGSDGRGLTVAVEVAFDVGDVAAVEDTVVGEYSIAPVVRAPLGVCLRRVVVVGVVVSVPVARPAGFIVGIGGFGRGLGDVLNAGILCLPSM